MSPYRSKITTALLAALLGTFSAHSWYLHRPWAWLTTLGAALLALKAALSSVWWDNPAFFLLVIPATAGFIEALVFSLKPDTWFDARYNPHSERRTHTGWAPVLIAIFSTIAGSALLLFVLALSILHVYKALGWLDGYTVY